MRYQVCYFIAHILDETATSAPTSSAGPPFIVKCN